MGKELSVRRTGDGPVPPATGGLPGGVAAVTFVWSSMASETHAHHRREELMKRRMQGISCHLCSSARRRAASCQSAG